MHFERDPTFKENTSKVLAKLLVGGESIEVIVYNYIGIYWLYLVYTGNSVSDIFFKYKLEISKRNIFKGVARLSKFENFIGVELEMADKYCLEVELDLLSDYDSKKETGYVGLNNIGANCYINSFLQTLFHISKFQNDFYTLKSTNKIQPLQKLWYHMNNDFLAVDPTEFIVKNVKSEEIHSHQDIHEFSKVFFDMLETESKQKEIINSLIEGQVKSFIKGECGCESVKNETFQDIQVEIRDWCNNIISTNLNDSLRLYTSVEILQGDNKYKCDTHGLVQAKKGTIFSKLPPILFVLLKRFGMDYERGVGYKINDKFDFPEVLDMKDVCTDEPICTIYNLYSVIVHQGLNEKGHYYSYICINNQWYKFDDSVVTKVPKEEAVYGNYGGVDPYEGITKQYSGYYLVYLRKDQMNNLLNCDIKIPQSIINEAQKEVVKYKIKCTTFKDLYGYKGPGIFNFTNFDYPMVGYTEYTIKSYENVEIIRKDLSINLKTSHFLSFFKITENLLVEETRYLNPQDNYFLYTSESQVDFTKYKLCFVKLYQESIWCTDTYPENLSLVFITAFPNVVEDIYNKISDNLSVQNFVLYTENTKTKLVSLFEGNLENGDILIVVKRECMDTFGKWYKEFRSRKCINVLAEGLSPIPFPMFLPKSLKINDLETRLKKFVLDTNKLEILKKDDCDNCTLGTHYIEKNTITLAPIYTKKLIYVTLNLNGKDNNILKHMHTVFTDINASGKDLVKKLLVSDYQCCVFLQSVSLSELVVIDAVKESMYLKKYNLNEVFTSKGINIIEVFPDKNYIKTAYFIDNFKIIGYPFYLFTNSKDIQSLREEFRIDSSKRIVKYTNNGYTDLQDGDRIDDMTDSTFMLIQRG